MAGQGHPLLYSVSARDPLASVGLLDWLHSTLVAAAMVVDLLALWTIGARISEMGWTPNRVASLGMNLVLLLNLTGATWLHLGFIHQRLPFTRLWRWQLGYLSVIASWAAVVAFLFPPMFGFR